MCSHFRQHEVLTRAEWILAQHLTDIGSVSACTLWIHHRQQKAPSSVEWLMARAGDSGPALNHHVVMCRVCWTYSVVGDLAADKGPTSSTLAQH